MEELFYIGIFIISGLLVRLSFYNLYIKFRPKPKNIYRVKELNKAYDHIFGLGKGWIYSSNELSKIEAKLLAKYYNFYKKPLKYTIEKI